MRFPTDDQYSGPTGVGVKGHGGGEGKRLVKICGKGKKMEDMGGERMGYE